MFGDVLRKLASLAASPTGPAVRAFGRVWHLSPEGEALFGSAGPAFDRWLADGSAEVVKHGPHRTVGIGAALPLAWGTLDTRWPGQSFLITRDLAPAIPFTDFIESRFSAFTSEEQRSIRRQFAHGLGRFLALLHDSGVAHPDPH